MEQHWDRTVLRGHAGASYPCLISLVGVIDAEAASNVEVCELEALIVDLLDEFAHDDGGIPGRGGVGWWEGCCEGRLNRGIAFQGEERGAGKEGGGEGRVISE